MLWPLIVFNFSCPLPGGRKTPKSNTQQGLLCRSMSGWICTFQANLAPTMTKVWVMDRPCLATSRAPAFTTTLPLIGFMLRLVKTKNIKNLFFKTCLMGVSHCSKLTWNPRGKHTSSASNTMILDLESKLSSSSNIIKMTSVLVFAPTSSFYSYTPGVATSADTL